MAKDTLDIFIEKIDAKHYYKLHQENPNKIKWCSKQNTYDVTNENIAPSEVTDNVEDERGDAFRGIPKLSLLVTPRILPWGALWRKYALEGIIKLLFISLFHDKCLLFMLELY